MVNSIIDFFMSHPVWALFLVVVSIWMLVGIIRFYVVFYLYIHKLDRSERTLLGQILKFFAHLLVGTIFVLVNKDERTEIKIFFKRIVFCFWRFISSKTSSVWHYRKNQKKKLEYKKAAEEEKAEANKAAEEKKLKDQKLIDWAKKNPVKIYYNVMNGVVAMLKEDDYKTLRRHHQRHITDEGINSTLPIPLSVEYIVFADKDRVDSIFHPFLTSDRRSFDMLDTEGFVFEKKLDIFVPFVNETIITFDTQRGILGTRYADDSISRYNTLQSLCLKLRVRKITDFPKEIR